ncbi:MAG: nicotinate (nicotinamide) nucleotide adenylyltransferase [Bacteroidetes bacterium]|nr:nicotinate (nicotinamide) nucleotide adenylyltransferase [Bacteroidota bacterium]
MNVALYFGSFNPIHKGHTSICKHIIDMKYADEVWLIVSPQSPFKKEADLAKEGHRINMATLALKDENLDDKVSVNDIELTMPKPSWTVDTLKKLCSQFPENRFSIIMGEDNIVNFDKWKEYKTILELCENIFVYPRKGRSLKSSFPKVLYMEKAPLLDYNSTYIRSTINKETTLINEKVRDYIIENQLYAK